MTNPLAKKKSLQTILSSFNKVVEDLRVLQVKNCEVIIHNNNKIEAIQAETNLLQQENLKAESVEAKINSLLE